MRLLSILLLALPLGGQDPASRTPPSELLLRAVPQDAFLLVSASELDGLRASAAENAWSKLLGDPELAPVRAWLDARLREGLKKARDEAGVDPLAFAGAMHEAVGLFFAQDEAGRMCSGFLARPGEEHAAFDGMVDTLLEHVAGKFAESSESYRDVALRVFEKLPGAAEEEEAEHDLSHQVFLESDGLTALVGGESRETALALAHGVIDRTRAEGGAEGLLASEVYREARGSAPRPGRVELFVDLQRAIAMGMKEAPPEEEDQKILDALGVPGLRWLHASADVGEGERLDLDLALRLPDQGYLRRWADLLGALPRDTARLLPRESVSIALYGYDLARLYRSAWEFAGEIAPDEAKAARGQFDQALQSFGGLDPEAHFIDQLSGEFATFSMPVPEEEFMASPSAAMVHATGEKPKGPLLGEAYVIGLKDPETVEVFVEDALKLTPMGELVDSEEFQGNTIYQLEMGPMTLSWAFTAKHGVLSMFPTALRAALRLAGDEKVPSVLQDERFKPHFAAWPQASAFGVAVTAEMLKATLTALGALGSMMGGALEQAEGDEASKDAGSDLAMPSLPPPAVIDRYLRGTIVTAVVRQGGVLRMTVQAQ